MRILFALLLALSLTAPVAALPRAASLERPLLPAAEWTPGARQRLSQALAGEAGWLPSYHYVRGRAIPCEGDECFENRDWRIIPYVLLRRWRDMRHAGRTLSFEQTITAYCSPLKSRLASPEYERRVRDDPAKLRLVYRRRFLQAIDWEGALLLPLRRQYESHLRRRAKPKFYTEGWEAIREVVRQFGAGTLPDVCPKARHWDWRGSTPGPSLRPVDCGETMNVYSAPTWMVERWEQADG